MLGFPIGYQARIVYIYMCFSCAIFSIAPLLAPQCSRPMFDASNDRLLTSEVMELHAKLQALEKENHELRQEFAKTTGVAPSRIRSKIKVCYPGCGLLMIYMCVCVSIGPILNLGPGPHLRPWS